MRSDIFLSAVLAIAFTPFQSAGAQICGNDVRESPEQCDDGNRASFDGCSASCRFEQTQRVNELKMQFATATACPVNVLGSAFLSTTQQQLQTSIDNSVTLGSTSALMYFVGLGDLSGISAPSVRMGMLNAAPISPIDPYNGNSDVDWWYLVDASELDALQNPLNVLSGSITAGVITAGPGAFALNTNFGAPITLSVSSVELSAMTGASSTPMTYSGISRGHLASENLDPLLQSFESSGSGGSPSGTLCGNVSAASLAAAGVPAGIPQTCTQMYTVANSMLDLIVGGCTGPFSVPLVRPTQPDQVDANAPAAGDGGPYVLSASVSHAINTCKDRNQNVVPLTACLNSAAYSFFFKFSTDRVIAKSPSDQIFHDDFEGQG